MQGMLGIFQKLVASRVHDQDGFRILEALVDNCPPDALQPYMPQARVFPNAACQWLLKKTRILPTDASILATIFSASEHHGWCTLQAATGSPSKWEQVYLPLTGANADIQAKWLCRQRVCGLLAYCCVLDCFLLQKP